MWKSGLIFKEKSVKLLNKEELVESQNKNYIAELFFHTWRTQTESPSTVIYISAIDLCSSELWAYFTAYEMFCFKNKNKYIKKYMYQWKNETYE